MIEITDEMLNKFVDGELDSETMNAVRLVLKDNPEIQLRLKALQSVDKNLRTLPVYDLSDGFTERVMNRLADSFRTGKAQKRFIITIASVFLIGCLAIFVLIISALMATAPQSSPGPESVKLLTGFIENLVNFFEGLFGGNAVSAIGSLISVGILISGYFFFENQRRLKHNGNA
ncbi:MAG: hypothetical protein Kow0098_12300 [Ignavibacteriaceae bacterium]